MKKSLLIFSAMALAAFSASAYDTLEPGTADSPNYYIIQANRGTYQYLGEMNMKLNFDDATLDVTLGRYNYVAPWCIWEVTPGASEGSVVIKNSYTGKYMMKFVTKDNVETVASGGFATLVDSPTDIFPVDMGGAYALNIVSATEAAYPDKCYSIDAPGGNAQYCGNYRPTQATSAEGSHWWVTNVTPRDGKSKEQLALEFFAKPQITELNTLAEEIPAISTEMQEGVDALLALNIGENIISEIATARANAIAKANEKLNTAFDGKTYNIANVRRWDLTPYDGPFFKADVANNKYVPTLYTTGFTFKSNGTGYKLFNEATNTYIGASAKPVESEDDALTFYIGLSTVGNYSGAVISVNADKTGNGLNYQSWVGGSISIYSVADEGSLWSIIPTDDLNEADIIKMASDGVRKYYDTNYGPYIQNVPFVATAFDNGVADAAKLTYAPTIDDEVKTIVTSGLSNANTLLETGLNNKKAIIKAIKFNNYMCYSGGTITHSNEASATEFTFKSVGNGGYTLHDEANDIYIGPVENGDYSLIDNAENAQAFYPVLNHFRENTGTEDAPVNVDYYGVSFAHTKGGTTGMNMNTNNGLHFYYLNSDASGSIFGMDVVGETTSIEVVEAVEPVVEGIYDLSGRRLAAPVRGINIINGKKVLIK